MWDILFVKKEGMLMKATGIVRKVDNLGRIVISKETRKTLQVETSDALEFFVGVPPHRHQVKKRKYPLNGNFVFL